MVKLALAVLTALIFLAGCRNQKVEEEKADLHMRVGASFFEEGDYPRALSEFLIAENLDPRNPGVQNDLGLTYFMRGRYDMSVRHIRKALELDPKFTDAHNNLARVYLELRRYAEAEAELKIVLTDLTYLNFERAYINYGLIYFNQAKYAEAKAKFQKAIESGPDSCLGHTLLGRSHFELQEYDRAAYILDRAVGLCQKTLFDEPHYYSALTYYRMGNKEKSEARFNEVVKLYPMGAYNEKAREMLKMIKRAE